MVRALLSTKISETAFPIITALEVATQVEHIDAAAKRYVQGLPTVATTIAARIVLS